MRYEKIKLTNGDNFPETPGPLNPPYPIPHALYPILSFILATQMLVLGFAQEPVGREKLLPQPNPVQTTAAAPVAAPATTPGTTLPVNPVTTPDIEHTATYPAPTEEPPAPPETTSTQPVAPPPATTTAPVTSIPTPAETPISDLEAEKLHEQLLVLDKVKNPEELFDYIRSTHQARNYSAAALGMAFGKTKYSTATLQRNCLAKWIYIIDRIEDIAPRDFPSDATFTEHYFHTGDSYERLDFVKDAGTGCWQIGPESITKTDEIRLLVEGKRPIKGDWLSKHLPEWMFTTFLGISYYQWTILASGFVIGILVYFVTQQLLYWIMKAYMHVVYHEATELSHGVWKQLAMVFMAYIWFNTYSFVVISPALYALGQYVFWTFTTIMIITITVKLVDLLAASLRVRILGKYSDANVDNLIIPLFSRTTKALVLCLGALSLAQFFGLPVVGILSGMGIGGIAIAFAAKETVANFFGSVTVLIDKPFDIGDWIVTDGVEGTVEAVGMRSTRIRTFYNSVITIPNNNLTTAVIDNMGRRRYRRLRTFLTMEYENDPDRIESFCEGIRELIAKNPFTLKENYSVSLYNLQSSSIDVLLNVFFICPSTATEYRERSKLLRNILKLASAMDVHFAYQTQRLLINDLKPEVFRPLPEGDLYETGRKYANQILFPDDHAAEDDEEEKSEQEASATVKV